MKLSKFVVIAGCGDLGGKLANIFSESGDLVVILDPDQEAFATLSPEFSGFTVAGSAAEVGSLMKARTSEADLFIAATNDDAINIMSAKAARTRFGVQRAIARIFDPSLEVFCTGIGVEVVSPVTATADRILGDTLADLKEAKL